MKTYYNCIQNRVQITYDTFLSVSKLEARNALKIAEEFVKGIIEHVKKENPHQKFDF